MNRAAALSNLFITEKNEAVDYYIQGRHYNSKTHASFDEKALEILL